MLVARRGGVVDIVCNRRGGVGLLQVVGTTTSRRVKSSTSASTSLKRNKEIFTHMSSGAETAVPVPPPLSGVAVMSTWNNIPMAPPDSILGITGERDSRSATRALGMNQPFY